MLDRAAPPLQFRSLVDVVRDPALASPGTAALPFTFAPAIALAVQQELAGTWNESMLTLPTGPGFNGIGTTQAVHRLIEYGFDRDTPPLVQSRRVLFRLLSQDDNPDHLYELGACADDEESLHRARGTLREGAAAALAHAGYEGDPRLRGAASRIVDRMSRYLASPGADKPFVRVGNQHVLPADAAPPSIHTLVMLAYMPLFRSERHESMELLYRHLSRALPRQDVVQQCGGTIIPQPQLVLGDQLSSRHIADADLPFTLFWLELMARLGFLRRNELWLRLFDRLLDDCNAEGVWQQRRGGAVQGPGNPLAWASFPLGPLDQHGRSQADVTFRLGLIARLAGRVIEVG
jgi:hypothetical protein